MSEAVVDDALRLVRDKVALLLGDLGLEAEKRRLLASAIRRHDGYACLAKATRATELAVQVRPPPEQARVRPAHEAVTLLRSAIQAASSATPPYSDAVSWICRVATRVDAIGGRASRKGTASE